MKSEIALRSEAMKLLTKNLGKIDTERFISSMKKDSFDYTEWRKDLWKDKTIEEINELAGQYEKKPHEKIIFQKKIAGQYEKNNISKIMFSEFFCCIII